MVLTPSQARAFYDRFGSRQDAQAFYEDAALDDLVAHAGFGQADRVFELGCGTGRFALRLLQQQLPAQASYLGTDLSRTMLALAGQRLAPYAERARLAPADGAMHFPLADHSVDRVVSTYVLDLLAEADIRAAIAEAQRVLVPGGRLCLVGLTQGVTIPSRIVSALWTAAFTINAALVGGCRPIRLDAFFERRDWSIEYRNVITRFGVPSDVLIASPKAATGSYPQRPG